MPIMSCLMAGIEKPEPNKLPIPGTGRFIALRKYLKVGLTQKYQKSLCCHPSMEYTENPKH